MEPGIPTRLVQRGIEMAQGMQGNIIDVPNRPTAQSYRPTIAFGAHQPCESEAALSIQSAVALVNDLARGTFFIYRRHRFFV